MCFRRKDAKMAKPPKRVRVILGQDKPTGDLKKWIRKQEKLRRRLIDESVAEEDARRLEEAIKNKNKKRRNGK